MNDALAGAAVGAVYLLLFAAAEAWRRRAAPPPEHTRKLVHVGGGLVALGFPWLFRSHWSVLALALAFAAILLVTRRFGLLRSVHGIQRESRGDLYFPVAVYLLFLVARHAPILYAISLFTLVVSDALAALLGRSYGRRTYAVGADRKSWEGSVIFFFTTFLGVHLPLLLFTDVERLHCVLVATQVALLVTCFEAISMRGIDNLVVPFSTYYLLLKMLPKDADWIGLQLTVQVGFLALVALTAWRTRLLTPSGAIAAHLVIYAAFSLGGPAWSVAPLLALAAYLVLDPWARRHARGVEDGYEVLAVFHVSIVAVLLIFADNTLPLFVPRGEGPAAHPFFVPYLAALAAQLAIVTYLAMRAHPRLRRFARVPQALAATLMGFFVVVPTGLYLGLRVVPIEALGVALVTCLLAQAAYAIGRRLPGWPHGALWDLRLQMLSVAIAVALTLPLHLAAATGAS